MNMKKLFTLAMAVVMSVSILSGCGGKSNDAPAADNSGTSADGSQEPVTLVLGQLGDNTERDYMGVYCREFIRLVEERTDGAIKIDYYPNCELGSQQAMLDQMLTGTLDFCPLSSSMVASIYPSFEILVMPFAFQNAEEFRAAEANGAFDKLYEESANGPLKMLSTFTLSWEALSNTKREVRRPEDIKGMNVRVVSGGVYQDVYNAMGATTSNISFSELYTALQQGVIDAECNAISINVSKKFYEVAKYHSQLPALMDVNPLMMSEYTEQKVTAEQLDIIKQCAVDACELGDKTYVEIMDTCEQEFVDLGGHLVRGEDFTEEEIQAFRDVTAPVWDKYAEQLGEEVYGPYEAAREAAGLA